MRAMSQPQTSPQDAYTACIAGIANVSLKQRIVAVSPSFAQAANEYVNAAAIAELYSLPPNSQKDDDILVGQVTKGEVKNMYSYYLVGQRMPARGIYDSLIASAPGGICPLCGMGYAVTLDHYLPKAKFPLLSILPQNLVPACRDCNVGKLASFAERAGMQSLHPYFDHGNFVTEQWLVATVIESSPATIRYAVSPPAGWPDSDKERVGSHFAALNLAPRFAVLAASELSGTSRLLASYVRDLGQNAVREYLSACARAALDLHCNSWKTAMFQALAASDWYCSRGFRE